MIPEELKYTEEHEWIRIEGEEVVIGITDHAQSELGDITFVELPAIGAPVVKMDSFATIESVKAASDIYAPLSGEITEINTKLEEAPEILNRDPYSEGWICRIKISDQEETKDFLSAQDYEKFIKGN